MTTKITNTFCYIIASFTFAAIFNDNIDYITHHDHGHSGEEIRVPHPIDEHLSRIQSGIKTGSAASVHQQLGCSVLPSGCPLEP